MRCAVGGQRPYWVCFIVTSFLVLGAFFSLFFAGGRHHARSILNGRGSNDDDKIFLSSDYTDIGEFLIHGVAPSTGRPFSTFRLPLVGTLAVDLVVHRGVSRRHFDGAALSAAMASLTAAVGMIFPGAVPVAVAAAGAYFLWTDLGEWGAHEFIAIFVLLVAALAAWRRRNPTVRRSLALAAAIGMSFLCRSVLAFFPPLLAISEWFSTARPRVRWKSVLVLCCVPYLFLIPWMRLNWALYRQIIPFERGAASSNIVGGAIGLDQTAEGDISALAGRRLNQHRTGEALCWAAGEAARHPFRYLRGFMMRLWLVFLWHPYLMILGLVGLWLARGRTGIFDVGLLAAYLLVVHCLMAIEQGYFVPLWSLLLVPAAVGIGSQIARPSRLEEIIVSKSAGALAAVVMIIGAAYIARVDALLWNYPHIASDADAARETLDRQIRFYPDDAWLLTLRGDRRLEAGDFASAAVDFGRAGELSPGDRGVRLRRAWARYLSGRPEALLNWRYAAPEVTEYVRKQDQVDLRARILTAYALVVSRRERQARAQLKAALEIEDRMTIVRGHGADDPHLRELRGAAGLQIVYEARDLLRERPAAGRRLLARSLRKVVAGVDVHELVVGNIAKPLFACPLTTAAAGRTLAQ